MFAILIKLFSDPQLSFTDVGLVLSTNQNKQVYTHPDFILINHGAVKPDLNLITGVGFDPWHKLKLVVTLFPNMILFEGGSEDHIVFLNHPAFANITRISLCNYSPHLDVMNQALAEGRLPGIVDYYGSPDYGGAGHHELSPGARQMLCSPLSSIRKLDIVDYHYDGNEIMSLLKDQRCRVTQVYSREGINKYFRRMYEAIISDRQCTLGLLAFISKGQKLPLYILIRLGTFLITT
jgi:hypothetical protein